MSYAEQAPQTSDSMARVRAFNSFVVWNIKDLLACRDYELLDRIPDPQKVSCRSAFTTTKSKRNPINLADGEWHHVAVTWSARNKGLTTIYVDGMKRAQAGQEILALSKTNYRFSGSKMFATADTIVASEKAKSIIETQQLVPLANLKYWPKLPGHREILQLKKQA